MPIGVKQRGTSAHVPACDTGQNERGAGCGPNWRRCVAAVPPGASIRREFPASPEPSPRVQHKGSWCCVTRFETGALGLRFMHRFHRRCRCVFLLAAFPALPPTRAGLLLAGLFHSLGLPADTAGLQTFQPGNSIALFRRWLASGTHFAKQFSTRAFRSEFRTVHRGHERVALHARREREIARLGKSHHNRLSNSDAHGSCARNLNLAEVLPVDCFQTANRKPAFKELFRKNEFRKFLVRQRYSDFTSNDCTHCLWNDGKSFAAMLL